MKRIELRRCGYTEAFGQKPYDVIVNGQRELQGFKVQYVPASTGLAGSPYWVIKSWSDLADVFMGGYIAERRFKSRKAFEEYLKATIPEWNKYLNNMLYGTQVI